MWSHIRVWFGSLRQLYRTRISQYVFITIVIGSGILLIGIGLIIAKDYRHRAPAIYTKKRLILIPTSVPTPTPPVSVRLPIIMYHYVEYVKETNDIVKKRLAINPALFEAQLKEFQKEGYVTYFARDIPDILSGKIKPASHSIVLTFDDGYEDFYTVAVPILQKYNMKGTDFVIYDFLDRKGFLTKQQVKELAQNPLVEIGAHTLDHVYLKVVPDSVARKQIVESKTDLEVLTGKPVETFAYPYGAYNNDTANIIKEASFTAALSTNFGVIQTQSKQFILSRVRAGALIPQYETAFLNSIQK